ncbi:MAG: molybdate ABC transporter permease subunit [Microcystis wesenbergii Mw_QC_S_20081001_S30D]|jgi:molybdate transport system permease protein|uniref:Molybdate ABC transporter permease subunit n=1 Tax=Microcystis wesenbergii Mw_QC_S_20081001_S30D TaxID=2486245 RepID=A0A552JVZ9_9CHRO|nr:molybdate ABC transporter permease subunit [Microcystis aeruginosa W11-03]NCR94449.1 molybdate ABC transporter permease subunit [Microcystis aeruginosa W11-06]TRU99930.1 MAG: molybdate ABC transporter permease subunit [Microcystis wesenbergii Mw_QC_S_20081001_S30D]TRU99994.1 MAG: molybdate ABC transporter permease subunit [Microcystis wesenbergii Mw_QC_S_20081001_S30]TRV03135.1 MAG: molybdate ABC transporter permease subunit [Microcystis wesenbergii Mw_QC_B_20070930_S4D]TRV08891.1 MAG: moly
MPDFSPLGISLKTATIALIIIFFLGIAAAYWMLGYRGRWKSLIEGVFVAPLILPPTVLGFILLLLFGKNGPLGQLLDLFNFRIVFTWYAAVITATVVAFPLMYKTTLGAFEQVDANLLQVARTLGASEGKIFWRLLLPLSFPGVLAGLTLAFARALGEFGATLMLAGNIPGQTQTIPMAIFFAVEAGAMTEAWIWVFIIILISLSGIIAVNLWQSQRKQQLGRLGESKPNEMEDWLQPWEGRDFALLAAENPHYRDKIGLFVDIEKYLPGFNLSVTFNCQNQPLGLLGASGSGKSLILRSLAGVETPSRGRIVLNGRILFDSEKGINLPSRQRRIGFVVQNYALFPHLTVAENIAFGLPKNLSKKVIKQQITNQLELVQLLGMENRYPHQLSGGQQQRVAIARALASRPEALLLDEPFSALDTHLRAQLERQMIKTLSNYDGVTIFVTHNMDEAYRICENLLVMEKGRAIANNSKQKIFERPDSVSLAKITGCKNFSRAIIINNQQLEAIDWDVKLYTVPGITDYLAYTGIRAHQIIFGRDLGDINTFPCWLANAIEGPHRVTLYLKLNQPSNHDQDFHIQAELYKDKWLEIKEQALPWTVTLSPQRLLLLK